MKNFSIATLFPTEDGSKPYRDGSLDIKTLYSKPNDSIFDSRKLLNFDKLKRDKIEKHHSELYATCWKDIEAVNNMGTKHIIFTVTKYILECPEYNSLKCLKYINERLLKQHFDTKIISDTDIFISWHNLEKKLSNHKQ